jgi:integrase/recombinase XerD
MPPTRTINTEDAVVAYLASCSARGLAPKTLQAYAWALTPLANASLALPDRPEALEKVLAALVLSPESRHDALRVWKTFYSWASKRLGVQNAAQQLAPVRRRQLLPRTLSEDQVDQLLQLPLCRRDRALLLLLLDTGLRVGELAGLTRRDIATTTFTVSGKTGKRQIPVSPHVRAALIGVGAGPVLWVGPKGPLTINGVKQAIRRVLRRTGVAGGPHLLRHTFARLYITAGGDVFSLQRILGHRQIATTRIYVDLDLRDVQAQHARFSPVARRATGTQGRLLQ